MKKIITITTLLIAALTTGCATYNAWHVPTRIKQPEKLCTATSVVHALMGEPKPLKVDNPYQLVYELDQLAISRSIPNVLSVAIERGYVKSYKYIGTVDALERALLDGPVLLTLPLYDSMLLKNPFKQMLMMDPYPYKPISIWRPKGHIIGYHTVLINGHWPDYDVFNAVNTWGVQWGHRGEVSIEKKDMETFFKQGTWAAQITK